MTTTIIDLSILCKAAARNDRRSVTRMLLLHYNDNGDKHESNDTEEYNGDLSMHLRQQQKSSKHATALLHLLFHYQTDPLPDYAVTNSGSNCSHKDNFHDIFISCDVTKDIQSKRQHDYSITWETNINNYFSNVIFNHYTDPSQIFDTNNNDKKTNACMTIKNQESLKTQLLMIFKSLLLLPWWNPSPWDTIVALINDIVQFINGKQNYLDHYHLCPFQHYFFLHDDSVLFTSNILNYIKTFLQNFRSDIESMCSSYSTSLSSLPLLQYYDKIHGIQIILQNILSTVADSILFSQHKPDDINNSNHDYNEYQSHTNNTYTRTILLPLLFEIIVLVLETGLSIENYYIRFWNKVKTSSNYNCNLVINENDNHNYYHHTDYRSSYQQNDNKKDIGIFTTFLDILYPSLPLSLLSLDGNQNNNIRTMHLHVIASYLMLSRQINHYLSERYWTNICQIIHMSFSTNIPLAKTMIDEQCVSFLLLESIQNDILNIFQVILDMIASGSICCNDNLDVDDIDYNHMSHNNNSLGTTISSISWTKLLVELYVIATSTNKFQKRMELRLHDSIMCFTPKRCKFFIDEIVKVWDSIRREEEIEKIDNSIDIMQGNNVVKGACLNIIFIILHWQYKHSTQNVSHLLSISLDDDEAISHAVDHSLYELFLLASVPMIDKISFSLNENQINDFQSFFSVLCYTGDGHVQSIMQMTPFQRHVFSIFENLVQLMYCCVTFHKRLDAKSRCMNRNESTLINEIQRFINVAESTLNSNREHESSFYCKRILFSSSIFITLFMELESSRSILIKYFTETLAVSPLNINIDDSVLYLNHVIVWTLACITKSLTREELGHFVQDDSLNTNNPNLHQYYQPLCDVLTKMLGNNETLIQLPIVTQLMAIVSFAASGRKAILNIVHQNIQKIIHVDEWKICSRYNLKEWIAIVIEGLLILIQDKWNDKEHMDTCTLDQYGLEALIRIVNMMVVNRPSTLPQNRSVLFSKLVVLIEGNKISPWVAKRILASSLMSLLPHFRSTASSRLLFSPIRGSDELNSNLNLSTMMVMTILQYESEYPKNINALPFSCDEIDTLVPFKRIPQKAHDSEIPTLRGIAFRCIGAMITYLTHTYSKKPDSCEICQHLDTSVYLKHIHEMEISCFRDVIRNGQDELQQQNWYMYLHPQLIQTQAEQKAQTNLLFYNEATIDCFVNLLIQAFRSIFPQEREKTNERVIERMLSLLTSIGILTDARQQNVKSSDLLLPKDLGESSNISNITAFFLLALETLTFLLEGGRSKVKELNWVGSLVDIVIHFFDSTRSFHESLIDCHESTYNSHIEAINVIWSFYNSCCNEIKCCELIDFIEARSIRICTSNDESPTGLTSDPHNNSPDERFLTVEQIYDFVREFRSSVILCLGSIFQFHSKQNIWQNKENYFLFSVNVACTLTHDLTSGLNGVSGGITQSFYRHCIQIIQEVVQSGLLYTMDNVGQSWQEYGYDILSDLKHNCISALNSLCNVIYVFKIKRPCLFKTSFYLCSTLFPQLLRRIERITILNFPTIQSTDNIMMIDNQIDAEIHAFASMKDCIDVVEAFIGNKMEKKSKTSNTHALDAESGLKYILSNNEKLLEWTLGSCITMVEKYWNDTWQYLQDAKANLTKSSSDISLKESFITLASSNDDFELLPAVQEYATKRYSTTNKTLFAIIPLLSPLNYKTKGSQQQPITVIEKLSLSTKRRLYTCLERIFATLKICTQLMIKYIQEEELLMNTTVDKQLGFAESMSCILSLVSQSDFITSLCNLNAMLSSSVTIEIPKPPLTTTKANQTISTDVDHARMKKIFHKMEQIDKLLYQFYNKLIKKSNNHDGNSNVCGMIKNLDDLTHQCLKNYEKDTSFLQILDEHIDQVAYYENKNVLLPQQNHQLEQVPIKQISSSSSSSSTFSLTRSKSTTATTRTTSEQIKKHVDKFSAIDNRTLKKRLKEAQREKKRSRNEIVNEWMYLDCAIDDDEDDYGKGTRRGGRRKGSCFDYDVAVVDDDDDDNFEDLEDFLLPG